MNDAYRAPHQQPDLFDNADGATSMPARETATRRCLTADDAATTRIARVRRSMLWAAYGDALGFISELVDRKGLERRTKGAALTHLMEWRRRVGGRQGVEVSLPAGCWSDDTQLRMAVSRSIGGHGFDIETFARIELPVWPSYALGGGLASKAAAKNLARPDSLWYANTYPKWANAGGNGAAMRVQPHVWASASTGDEECMLEVISNSICTHGHPRAIVGACFHAATLSHTVEHGAVPDLATCQAIAARVHDLYQNIEDHSFLGQTWTGLWERETGLQLRDTWRDTVNEVRSALALLDAEMEDADGIEVAYKAIVEHLGLGAKHQRGSGILTSVAAAALAATASNAHEAVVAATNALGTDTDTIATMAAALLGACDAAADPPEEPLDSAYLRQEADRLYSISQGVKVDSHAYPDVLTWSAPRTQADALVHDGERLIVQGLGAVTELDALTARGAFAWQWVRTDFGQTLLIKRRLDVKPLGAGNGSALSALPAADIESKGVPSQEMRPDVAAVAKPLDRGIVVDVAVRYAKEQIDDDSALGYTVRRVARDGTLADLAALVTAVRDDLRL